MNAKPNGRAVLLAQAKAGDRNAATMIAMLKRRTAVSCPTCLDSKSIAMGTRMIPCHCVAPDGSVEVA